MTIKITIKNSFQEVVVRNEKYGKLVIKIYFWKTFNLQLDEEKIKMGLF